MAKQEVQVQVEEGPVPVQWDARYPQQGQTAADAPPGYITLFADFFLEGNFRLPTTHFMGAILHYYGFHISQMSPTGMVRVRHFEFLCRSHGLESDVANFRAMYQWIRNMGFYSFASLNVKKVLQNPPKSFHDWKMKFFFIREEVMPIAMIFRESDEILKKDLPLLKKEMWYVCLTSTPNRVFGEQVLIVAGMSNRWHARSEEVPVLLLNGEVKQLYQAAFTTFAGAMGVRPLESGEAYWYEQIKDNFMYPLSGAFANPPTATGGAHLPNPRPLCVVTSAEKEILYLSSEEFVGSSNGELSSWSNIFAGVLRNLGIDPGEKKKKACKKKTKKVITIDAEATSKKGGSSRATAAASDKGTLRFRQSNLEDYVVASDSLEGLSRIGEKKASAAGSKSSGSTRSRVPEAGMTPSSIAMDEGEEEEHEEEAAAKLVSRKRSREEVAAGAKEVQKNVGPVRGKQSSLHSLYKFSPEALKKTPEKTKGVELKDPKEPTPKKMKFIIRLPKTTEREVEKMFKRPTGSENLEKDKQKEIEIVAATEHAIAHSPEERASWGLTSPPRRKKKKLLRQKGMRLLNQRSLRSQMPPPKLCINQRIKRLLPLRVVASAGGSGGGGSAGAAGGAGGSMPQSPIGPKDTLGDIYYNAYTEEARGDAPH
ncbi:hypothetical protein Hanom_Chr14g01255581 [Helianthus anomalus]